MSSPAINLKQHQERHADTLTVCPEMNEKVKANSQFEGTFTLLAAA